MLLQPPPWLRLLRCLLPRRSLPRCSALVGPAPIDRWRQSRAATLAVPTAVVAPALRAGVEVDVRVRVLKPRSDASRGIRCAADFAANDDVLPGDRAIDAQAVVLVRWRVVGQRRVAAQHLRELPERARVLNQPAHDRFDLD